jgi:transcriptional regulator with XRE-family HTH domain
MTGDGQPSSYIMRDYDHALAVLREARAASGITIDGIGYQLFVDRPNVSRWLSGKMQPAARRFFELANALGLDVALVPRAIDPAQPTGDGSER